MYEFLDELWEMIGITSAWAWPFLDVIVLIALSIVVYQIILMVMRRYIQISFRRQGLKEVKRYETLYSVLKSLVKYVGIVIVFFLVFNRFGIDATALFAGAGVLGAVTLLVFQDFVKDLIAGFYFIFEKVFVIDDIITIGSVTGTIVGIGVRSTTIRNLNGDLVTFMNHDITQVKNYSSAKVSTVIQSFVFALGLDVNNWIAKLNESLPTFLNGRLDIIESPVVLGIVSLKGAGLTIDIQTKVKPLSQWAFQRDFNAFMYQLCQQHGFVLAVIPTTVMGDKL